MPPENPEKLETIKKTAIQEAEAQTKSLEQYEQGEIPETIDSSAEVKLFFDTVYALINKYIDETNDPALIAKKQELETVYKDQKTREKKYYLDAEKVADEYWESLVAIMEKEERQALEHGQDLLKTLGIADSCKIIKYRKYEDNEKGGEVNSYEIEKDHLTYYLDFNPNGEIEILFIAHGETSKYLHLYKSQETNYKNRPDSFLKRSISLAELKDLSAFKTYLSPLGLELSWAISEMKGTLNYLPKRSTNPALQPFIEFRDELSRFSEEIYKTRKEQDYKLTREQHAHYLKKIAEYFKKRLRQYFDTPDKTNPITKELRTFLSKFVEEYPPLIDTALEEVKTIEELQLFNFSREYENYLYAKVECKRDELSKTDTATFDKEVRKYNLSKKQKETLITLQKSSFIKKEDFPRFIPIFKSIRQEILGEYLEFTIGHPDKFSAQEALILFTSYSKDLSTEQFGYYTSILSREDFYVDDKLTLKNLNNVLRANTGTENLELAGFLFCRGEEAGKIKNFMVRIKKLARKLKTKVENIRFLIMGFRGGWPLDTVMATLENLDSSYVNINHVNTNDDYSSLSMIRRHFRPSFLKPRHFKKLNALKPFQRKGFNYLEESSISLFKKPEDIDQFLDILSNVQSEPEMEYILLTAPHFEMDVKAFMEGAPLESTIIQRESIKGFSETTNETAKYRKLWEEMVKVQETKGKKFSKQSYEIIKLMFDKNFDEQAIIDTIQDLIEIETTIQKETIVLLMTKENARDLLKSMALCNQQCQDIDYSYNANLTQTYYKAISQKPPINGLLDLIQRLTVIQQNEESLTKRNNIMLTMVEKSSDYEELLEIIASIENPQFIENFKEVTQCEDFRETYSVNDLAEIYFYIAVSPDDLKTPKEVMQGLKAFLSKALKEKYDPETDPDYNRATSFLDPVKLLEKEDTGFSHIAFILNILQNSSPEFSKEKLTETALKFLENPKEIIQEKGAKLLIGLGTITQTLDQNTIIKIVQKGVDGKLTKFTLLDKITTDQLEFIQQQGSPQLPLSLYFSFLITLEQTNKSKDQPAFEALVKKYKDLENEPIYKGEVLILSYNPNDKTHSYLFAQDSFNPEGHKTFAKDVQGLHVETLRHGEDNESIESMFSKLEMTKGDLTLIIGGHGTEDYISFGEEGFYMNQLFERLKQRVKQQKEGQKWTTTIIFESCHSDYNVGLLNKLWFENPETKNFPIKMLSSSNEDMPSAKMAKDSWDIKAREAKATGKPLTWGEFYRDIESKSFIMSDSGTNSNSTLFIDGEELGAIEASENTAKKVA
ncbi:MAG: hypothetical protein WC285_00965 [Candidatus Gracilibacteria bacterium]|jgi:hypothetical protein